MRANLRTGTKRSNRRATTLMESIIACSLLVATMVTVSILQTRLNRAYNLREQMMQIRWEVQNARQVVGCWKLDQIDDQHIAELPISQQLTERLPDIHWVTRVETAIQPVDGKQIFLGLQWTQDAQLVAPVGIMFWVAGRDSIRESQP